MKLCTLIGSIRRELGRFPQEDRGISPQRDGAIMVISVAMPCNSNLIYGGCDCWDRDAN
jgi:hypothetical protein